MSRVDHSPPGRADDRNLMYDTQIRDAAIELQATKLQVEALHASVEAETDAQRQAEAHAETARQGERAARREVSAFSSHPLSPFYIENTSVHRKGV